ncbi:MAG: alkaline phosphatase family protein [Sporichthyaceae bacterium]
MNAAAPQAPPPYGSATLAEVMPTVLAAIGVPDEVAALPLDLPRRVAVLLVDGMGSELLAAHAHLAPCLADLATRGGTLGVGFPSTTATSLTSLGTGLPPGAHGVLGLTLRKPDGGLLTTLHWDAEAVDPLTWQPYPTAFERAAAAGVAVSAVGPRRFWGSGLNIAAFRGARPVGAESAGEVVAATLTQLAAGPIDDPALVYSYYGDLDATGHREGCGSLAWRLQLAHLDRLVEQLVAGLPADTALVVTADHGMLDAPQSGRVDFDAEPELARGVELLAGEPRARYVYAVPGAAADVLAAWGSVLGPDWCVLSRGEAIATGWFGPPHRVRAELVGDVVAVPRTTGAIVASVSEPIFVSQLVGMHGGLTSAEQRVPLLVKQG